MTKWKREYICVGKRSGDEEVVLECILLIKEGSRPVNNGEIDIHILVNGSDYIRDLGHKIQRQGILDSLGLFWALE